MSSSDPVHNTEQDVLSSDWPEEVVHSVKVKPNIKSFVLQLSRFVSRRHLVVKLIMTQSAYRGTEYQEEVLDHAGYHDNT